MSVGRQKCQLDVSQKYQKCQLDVRNVSWTSKKISKMSVGRQKCQLDVKKNIENVSWTSEMSVGRQKYYILEYGEDITSVSRARKGS